MNAKKSYRMSIRLAALAVAASASLAHAQDHPFALRNVVDLFQMFALDPIDNTFNPVTQAPANFAAYSAAPRVGTNPSVVAVDGDRAFIGGFYNGPNFNRFGDVTANRFAWYASVGVAEIRNIGIQSGFTGDWTRYLGTFQVGPGIRNTDWMSGLDYDPISKRLYVAYDAIQPPFPTVMPNAGLPWQFYETFIAAVDADPDSPTYGQNIWKRENPVPAQPGFPADEVRAHAGVSIDTLNNNWLAFPVQGAGRISFFDLTNPFGPTVDRFVSDVAALNCNSTAFRGNDFHPQTGQWYSRVLNGIQVVRRDTTPPVAPFKTKPRFIREPSAGGNGTADTIAAGDDVQLIPFGDPVNPSDDIIGAGPNQTIDTVPGGDDVYSVSAIFTERIVGNPAGPCPTDPNGLPDSNPNGTNPQGQGLAIITSDNLVATPGWTPQDMLVVNSRPGPGANQLTDLRFFDLNGNEIASLPLPCSPVPAPDPTPSGVAIHDFDYDPATGTLVVLEFERRLLYVYKAQTTGGPKYPRYDYTRNGSLDLADFAGFQRCYTGPENPGTLSLLCQLVNTDSDCDVDFVDYAVFQATWDISGGPAGN
mgnify:CR=1 FL=1